MYSVFGDESSDERRERVFAVGGIFGDERQWEGLAKKWTAITGGEEFHAAEWDVPEPKRRNQYKKLVKSLAESKLIGFGAAMCLEKYERLFPRAVDYLPYYECFLDVIGRFAHCAGLCLPRGTVKFTFDQNLEVQYHASKLYHFIISKPDWLDREFVSDEISYATRKNPKIQAADLWTREVMKYADNSFGPVKRPIRRSLEVLRKENRFWIKVYEDSYFELLKARFDKLSRSDSPSNFEKYQNWIKERNMQDNTENRMHYTFMKMPTES